MTTTTEMSKLKRWLFITALKFLDYLFVGATVAIFYHMFGFEWAVLMSLAMIIAPLYFPETHEL